MRSFDDLVAEAATVDVSGWDFSWLDGRATEQRPPWGYARLLAERLPRATSALDLDTGGGEIIAQVPTLPARMTVTETWQPNLALARVPDFSVERYAETLRRLDAVIRTEGAFVAHSTRHLIEAVRHPPISSTAR